MSGEFSRAPMVGRPGTSLAEVYLLKPVGLGWRSARVTPGWLWRSCKVTKEDLADWMICAAKPAVFFDPKTEVKNGLVRAPWTRVHFISARFASILPTISAFMFWGSPCWCLMMAVKIFAKI